MTEQKLKKYLGASNGLTLALGLFVMIFGLGIVFGMIGSGDMTVIALIMSLFFAGTGGLIVWSAISNAQALKKQLEQMRNSGELDRVLREYDQAEVLVKGNIRLGQTYIFGKGSGKVLRYGEIRQIYQHVKKRNFVESSRTLKYVGEKGVALDLCQLQLRGKSDEDVQKIVLAILAKNPMVKVGYK